jgi:hypothetical protein
MKRNDGILIGVDAADVFCARCGEKQPDHHDYKLTHVAGHAFHELVHLDSIGIWLVTVLMLSIPLVGAILLVRFV